MAKKARTKGDVPARDWPAARAPELWPLAKIRKENHRDSRRFSPSRKGPIGES